MYSLIKAFSNFKDFYNEINHAILTGAIDVIVVEQPNGEFRCSPFHVRFGRLDVLRCREKIVDIELNGQLIDIHMKLSESGEAFFVEECSEDDIEKLPDNLSTSSIEIINQCKAVISNSNNINNSSNNLNNKDQSLMTINNLEIPLPTPSRISIHSPLCMDGNEVSIDMPEKFENVNIDYVPRKHTDNILTASSNTMEKTEKYITQKLQECAEHETEFQCNTSNQQQTEKYSEENQSTCQDNSDTNEIYLDSAQNTPKKSITKIPTILTEITSTSTRKYSLIEKKSNTQIQKLIYDNSRINSPTSSEVESINDSSKEQSKRKRRRKKRPQLKKGYVRRSLSTSSITSLEDNNNRRDTLSTTSIRSAYKVNSEKVNKNQLRICQDNSKTNIYNNKSVTINTLHHASSSDETSPKSKEQTKVSRKFTVKSGSCATIVQEELHDLQSDKITCNDVRTLSSDIHFFSDTEVVNTGGSANVVSGNTITPDRITNTTGRNASRTLTPIQSDSELELFQREKETSNYLLHNSALWKWGQLPTPANVKDNDNVDKQAEHKARRNSMLNYMFNFMKSINKIRKQVNDGEMYLSELDENAMKSENTATNFPTTSTTSQVDPLKTPSFFNESKVSTDAIVTESPTVSGSMNNCENGDTNLTHAINYSKIEENKFWCNVDSKYLDSIAMSMCGLDENCHPTDEEFERNAVTYENVCKNPNLFTSPNLVVRFKDKYYKWASACAIIMTLITFRRPLPNDTIQQITSDSEKSIQNDTATDANKVDSSTGTQNTIKQSWWYWRRSPQPNSNENANSTVAHSEFLANKHNEEEKLITKTSLKNNSDTYLATPSNNVEENFTNGFSKTKAIQHYRKTLRLSSNVIKRLNLKDGINEIQFSVTTAYQGTTRCKCCLFRWKYNDKIVISDIDGTITKSDVLGHILPLVGKDWAQLGVAQLFSKIEQNGYKILYLSARSIGQSRLTREYLRSIRQANIELPDGPILLNPASFIQALHREVIECKSELFKIECLSDIKDLFPSKDPFYAGYGNRINDVWAYRAVGIPLKRIFTINTKGEVRHELTQTFQSSYSKMVHMVDQMFPPIQPDEMAAIEYSYFNYWRDPIPDLNIINSDDFPSTSAVPVNSNSARETTQTH